jgi:4-hydroxythreonine-4-phosphate dehydrogenase
LQRLGITLGDPSGIGPEVALKALGAEGRAGAFEYVLLGDRGTIERTAARVGLKLPLGGSIRVEHCGPELPEQAPCGSRIAAESAMAALKRGAELCLAGELAGMVTAPVHKESIIRLGKPFMGQTEFLSEMAGARRTAMMLLGADEQKRWLRVALVTTHVPIRAVAESISEAKVQQAIELAAEACRDLALPRTRVAVCGLNPHAGEGGEIGTEEITTIGPAIAKARASGCDVAGPIPADTLFYYALRGHYDAVVAMYHDQGLAPLKMIGFESGINWTLGLPFIRTSPDHGTAFDIAGQNKANPASMVAALNLARTLAERKAAGGS